MLRPAVVLLAVLVAAGASAQVPDSGSEEACEGCPRRRPMLAVGEVALINVFYNLANRVLPTEFQEHFSVSPSSWARNIGEGFSWDNDPFVVNQFGHPYQGGNYFCAGRANGLGYWASLPLAAVGSVTWEWLGEKEHPAWNDVINTTLGGAAFGEILHRISWLVRDPRQAGRGRVWREIGAALVEPIGGVNRFVSGDARRPGDTPPTFHPARAVGEIRLGSVWQADGLRAEGAASRNWYGSFALDYGALERGPVRAPFDAFTMAVRVGGGATVSAASIRGRLAGRPLGAAHASARQALIVQEYGYREAPGFLFGEQTVLAGVSSRFDVRPGLSIVATALGGPVVLGAIDSPAAPEVERGFDYGPGASATASADVVVGRTPVVRLVVAGWWLRTVTREPARHLLSLVRVEGRIPVGHGVHVVVEAERATRTSRIDGAPRRSTTYPELRAGLAWRFGR